MKQVFCNKHLMSKYLYIVGYHIIMIVIISIFLLPILFIILTAIRPGRLITEVVNVLSFQPTIINFVEAITKYKFHIALLSSLIISFSATFVGILIASPAAYAIQRFNQNKVAFMVLTAMMMPYIVCTIPLFLLFRRLGWYDTYLGLVMAHLVITIPQSVWILLGFVQGIPSEIEDAALVDGCSGLSLFIRIIFPLLKSGLIAASILSFILSWNNFSLALMLGGSKVITAPLALFNFVGEAGVSWGGLTASATMMIIPTTIFTLCVHRYLTEGLLVGSIK